MPVSRPLVLSGSGFPLKSVTRKAKISDNKLSRKCCVVYDFDSFQVSFEESMIDLLCRLQSTPFGRMSGRIPGGEWRDLSLRGRGNIEVVGRPTKRRTAAALNLELWEGYARGRHSSW